MAGIHPTVNAQQEGGGYNESVVVKGSYTPVIELQEKLNFPTTLADTQSRTDRHFQYSISPTRMKALYESESLPEMQWVMAENQLKSAKAHEAIARKALSDTRLCAPFSGFISAKMAEVGQAAAPGMPVVKLVSISTVKVKIAGSGDVKLKGKTDHFDMKVAGSGKVDTSELITK